MKKLIRQTGSLAESLAAPGSSCPIPSTHDKLHEAHYWWHEMAETYHDPNPFRYSLGAFVQSARSVTFMLQKEKSTFEDFTWYEDWTTNAAENEILQWLNSTRREAVHLSALAPHSWMRVRCISNPRMKGRDRDGISIAVDPFESTHRFVYSGPGHDHPHAYERHWEISTLPGYELLEACALAYDELDRLVSDAHARAGAPSLRDWEKVRHELPCMDDTKSRRTIRSRMRDGVECLPAWKRRHHGH